MWNDQKNVYKCPNIIVEDTDNLKCLFYKTFLGNYLLINTFNIQLVSGFDDNCFSSWCKEYYAVNTTIKCTCSYYDLIWSYNIIEVLINVCVSLNFSWWWNALVISIWQPFCCTKRRVYRPIQNEWPWCVIFYI